MTGLAGSGKTTLVNMTLNEVKGLIGPLYTLMVMNFKDVLNDLGYSLKDRNTNVRG